jgi:hypothetical protein
VRNGGQFRIIEDQAVFDLQSQLPGDDVGSGGAAKDLFAPECFDRIAELLSFSSS